MEGDLIMDKNEVKKELYKSKANAKFSHYVSGNLYYTVEIADGIYQFPIATVEEKIVTIDNNSFEYSVVTIELSSDLGTTSFYAEIRGSELSRWISKAIDKEEFIKLN